MTAIALRSSVVNAQSIGADEVRRGIHRTVVGVLRHAPVEHSDGAAVDLDGDGVPDRILEALPGGEGGPPVHVAALRRNRGWCGALIAQEPMSVNHNGSIVGPMVFGGRAVVGWAVEHHSAGESGTGYEIIQVVGCGQTRVVWSGHLRSGTPTFRVGTAGALEVVVGQRVVARLRWRADGQRLERAG